MAIFVAAKYVIINRISMLIKTTRIPKTEFKERNRVNEIRLGFSLH